MLYVRATGYIRNLQDDASGKELKPNDLMRNWLRTVSGLSVNAYAMQFNIVYLDLYVLS